jgi:hypothetical protein
MRHDSATTNSDLQLRILWRSVQCYELCSPTCHWRVTQLLTFLWSMDDNCCGDVVSEYSRNSDTSPSHPPPSKKTLDGVGWTWRPRLGLRLSVHLFQKLGILCLSGQLCTLLKHFVSYCIAVWTSKHLVFLYGCINAEAFCVFLYSCFCTGVFSNVKNRTSCPVDAHWQQIHKFTRGAATDELIYLVLMFRWLFVVV